MKRSWAMGVWTAAALASALPHDAGAQAPGAASRGGEARVLGSVTDHERGAPIAEASVTLAGAGGSLSRDLTDDRGAFRLREVPPGRWVLTVEALGYVPFVDTLEVQAGADHRVEIRLSARPLALDPVVTVVARSPGLAAFERRRASGFGTYIDRAEIEERRSLRLSDLLRGVAGARVVALPGSGYGMRFRGGCVPTFWVDGVRVPSDARLELDVNAAAEPDDIDGIEIYRIPATVPVEFRPEPCGAVVIWTRPVAARVDARASRSLWNRLAIVAGFLLLGVTFAR